MRLGLVTSNFGPKLTIPWEAILEAERLGFDAVWTAEAYGNDAIVPLSFIGARTTKIGLGTAIMQMPSRTPALTAMTAMSLDVLSGGRFRLGIGPSGPQVIEGWHGVAYGKPLTRTREYIEIIRKILAREEPVEYDGEIYQLPYRGPDATGLGKPLKSIVHPDPGLRIFTASISQAGLRCAAEVADGVIPVWMNPERFDLFEKPLRDGFHAAGGGKGLEQFEIAPFTTVVLGDDLEKCRMPVKGMLALYVGGMGARDKNFYNDYAKRLGYEDAAARIQDLYLAGKKMEAMAAVPDSLVDEVALVGPADRIRARLAAWREAGRKGHVGSILAAGASPAAMRLLAEELL